MANFPNTSLSNLELYYSSLPQNVFSAYSNNWYYEDTMFDTSQNPSQYYATTSGAKSLSSFVEIYSPNCSPNQISSWFVSSSCTLSQNYNAPSSVFVANNAILTIPQGVLANVNLKSHLLYVDSGGGVLVKPGGTIK